MSTSASKGPAIATSPYTPEFYENVRAGALRSAAAVVPRVLDGYPAHSVVDVGCGQGWWGQAFKDHGCEVLGLDGDYANPVIPWAPADLEGCIPNVGTFDLAVSLEVAEHLVPAAADDFIAALCHLAPVVLFSAAVPGQGGVGHLNEQWPAYWVERFKANGYTCSGALRWAIWDDDQVENWYRQNLLVAAREPEKLPHWFDTPLAPPWPVVHPVLYDARRP